MDAVGLINLPPGSIAEGIAVMRGTARDQAVLKRLAGVSARGRPTLDPYHHLTLAWKPGYRPTYDESDAAVSSALRKVRGAASLRRAVGSCCRWDAEGGRLPFASAPLSNRPPRCSA